MNGYATKEGITADLEAMQRAGLGGAQMFNVKMNLAGDLKEQSGPVTFMSPQWRGLVNHAIKESDRLKLEFSIMNCEGFSQSGGSWITPAQSMQKVVWSERPVTGGRAVKLDLPRPVPAGEYYADIALLAFPMLPGDEAVPAPRIIPSETVPSRPEAPLPVMPIAMPEKPQWVLIEFDRPREFSSVRLHLKDMRDVPDPEKWENSSYLDDQGKAVLRNLPGPHHWELQASDDGKTFRPVGRVATQGASPFPATLAKYFRLWLPVPPPLQKGLPLSRNLPMEFTEISFAGPRLGQAESRAGALIDYDSNKFSNLTVPAGNAIPTARLVVLTGRSEWDAPAGNWTLLRLGHASTGAEIGPAEIGGLEVDKLSRAAVRHHLEAGVVGAVVKDAGPLAGPVLQHLLFDSFEKGLGNWTPLLPDEFARRRGYPLETWLPTLTGRVVGSVDESERFLRDFRRTLADLMAENYYGTLRAFAREHGLSIYAEAAGHGLPALSDQLQSKGQVDVPMGEFWLGRFDVDDNKESASAAHIYGKPISASESFTSIFGHSPTKPWGNDPYSLKSQGDLQFTMGVNRMIFHRYAHQPWLDRKPGMTMAQCGTNFDRTNTWWEPGRAWIEYLARCQFMLQRGRFVADACYYYGENAPVDFRFSRMTPKLPPGYDFDACNAEVLATMTVRDGLLHLPSGMVYRTLVLPDDERMSPEIARLIRQLVRDGATVVGPKPVKSPGLAGYPACDRIVREIADEVWGDCDGQTVTAHPYGAGKVLWGAPMGEALSIGPDFTCDDPKVRYLHRRDGGTDIYFISNQADAETLTTCTFREDSRLPEIWHPDTGRHEIAVLYASGTGRTTVPLRLDPAGSVFIVFREQFSGKDPVSSIEHGTDVLSAHTKTAAGSTLRAPVLHDGRVTVLAEEAGDYLVTAASGRKTTVTAESVPAPVALPGPWRIEFPANAGAPTATTFAQLGSWTESTDEGIKYFSGTATYRNTFTLSAGHVQADVALRLDLGQVANLAEVTLNGRALGILWKPPFVVDLGGAAQPGENQLEIKVTNLWPNRLIGDKKLPPAQRTTWTTYNPYTADSPLLPSGLLGPVVVRAARLLPVGDWNQGRPALTVANYAYGRDSERQKLDFWRAKSAQPTVQPDATHSAVHGPKLAEALRAAGVEVVLTYPASPDPNYPTMASFLIAKLRVL
jgi:hypothetical protein